MSGPPRYDLPPIPDFRKQRFFDEKHEKARASNRLRQRKYLDRHRMEIELKRATPTLDAKPIGRPCTWQVKALVDNSGVIVFVGAVREGESLKTLTGRPGKEISLLSSPINRDEFAIIKMLTQALHPTGNTPTKRSKGIYGKRVYIDGKVYAFYTYY